MTKRILASLFAAALALGAAAETSEMKVERFQKLIVAGPLNVDCVCSPDSAGIVVVEAARADELSWVEAESSRSKLRLELRLPDDMRAGKVAVPANLPRVKVYTRYLTRVDNEGDSTVRVLSAADVPEFEARLMGNGRLSVREINAEKLKASLFTGSGILVVNGQADKATYSLTGVGTIEADGVECREAKVSITGPGVVGVHATKKLKIVGTGSGTVYSRGTPTLNRKLALGIKFQPIE